jgi:hypothetical protein
MSFNKKFFTTGGIVASSGDAACTTDSVQAFGANDVFSSNIALYQLDGNADDTTTNYDATSDTNVTYSATGAKFGQAASFNGSSSAIVLPNNILNTNEHSISLWFNLDDTNGIQTVLEMDFENRILFRAVSTDINLAYIGSVGYFDHGISFSANQWYHLVITFSAGNPFKIYVDGVLSYTGANSNIKAQNNDNILGASNSSGANGVDGKIDQVRIFDKAISAEDVATLYAETSSTASNTNPFSEGSGVALYTMDYDASEASGYYDGTPTNVDFGVGGQINYGARFNGSSSKIVTTLNPNGFSQIAISCWINTSLSTGVGSGHIVSANDGTSWCFISINKSTGIVTFGAGNSSSSIFSATHTGAINDGNWHHVVGSYNGTNATLYIDSTGHTPVSATASLSVNIAFGIGYRNTVSPSGTYYDGDIDQVRIFSKGLNQTEVDTLYNSGDGETACVYTATANTADFPSGATAVAHYPLDNSSEDNKGTNDGTDTNIEYRFGRYGQAAVFNGSNSKITLPSGFLDSAQTLSFSVWVNPTSFVNYTGILDKYIGSTSGWTLDVPSSTGKLPRIVIHTSGGGVNATATTALDFGNWTHIVGTISTSAVKIYINGTLENTSVLSTSLVTNTTPLVVGGDGVSTFAFDGSIDQVRIYSSALTSSQVTELYNEKPEVDTSNFKAVLYTGNADTDHYISNVGFQPDLVWVKNRSSSGNNHALHDSVRGVQRQLRSDTTGSENDYTSTNYSLKSYDANGFTVGDVTAGNYNVNGAVNGTYSEDAEFVAWVWKGGGDAVQNNDGTIQGANCMVSANTEAGFSIVKYTGNATAGATVGHGLSSAPDLIIVKLLDSTKNWYVFSELLGQSGGEYQYLELNTSEDATTFVNQEVWNGDLPTSDLFTLTGGSADNSTNNDYIAYCWHSVEGYSKIGTYSGNNNTNGPEITTGFKPSWIMIKRLDVSGHSWLIYDSVRSGSDFADDLLYANLSNSENPLSNRFEFKDTSFKILTNNASHNASGTDNFLYMAFK